MHHNHSLFILLFLGALVAIAPSCEKEKKVVKTNTARFQPMTVDAVQNSLQKTSTTNAKKVPWEKRILMDSKTTNSNTAGSKTTLAKTNKAAPTKADLDKKPPSMKICEQDSDCVITCLKSTSCCAQACTCSNSVTRDYLAYMKDVLHPKMKCESKQEECMKGKCSKLKNEYQPHCLARRCILKVKPPPPKDPDE